MDRRAFFTAVPATAVALASGTSPSMGQTAVDDRGPPVRWPDATRIPTVEEYANELDLLTGKTTPYAEEVMRGNELLQDPGLRGSPYQVAKRFAEWRKQTVGATTAERLARAQYTQEWPVRANPIIMGFFDATGLRKLEGDQTYWCAAFVSWCICRSIGGCTGLNYRCTPEQRQQWPYERGAGSAAYRSWGQATDSPKRGDLAVFQRSNWAGHVGFVEEIDGDTIFVLGGNQGAQNEYNGGEVNIARFRKGSSGTLQFRSFRTAAVLHP